MSSPARDTAAIILAGGRGTRLGPLTERECKPALPFGGHSRSIDFTLSNCIHSGIRHVGVATQYRPETLSRHIERLWKPIAQRHGACVEEWSPAACGAREGYTATADAVYKNWGRIARSGARYVLVLAGDHVYRMDYGALIEAHIAREAEATVACLDVGLAEARQFGIMGVAAQGWIRRFDEKPAEPQPLPGNPRRALASMGIYVFDTAFLARVLEADAASAESSHDFGHDLIPALIARARLFGYRFGADAPVGEGYWRDIGTPTAYWQAHMDLLAPDSPLVRGDAQWPILSAPGALAGSQRGGPRRRDVITAAGCQLGSDVFVHRSVLCEGVRVGAHSCIRDSVILPGASIGRNCYLDKTIVSAGCVLPDNTVIGEPSVLRANGSAHRNVEPMLVTPESYPALDRYPNPAKRGAGTLRSSA